MKMCAFLYRDIGMCLDFCRLYADDFTTGMIRARDRIRAKYDAALAVDIFIFDTWFFFIFDTLLTKTGLT